MVVNSLARVDLTFVKPYLRADLHVQELARMGAKIRLQRDNSVAKVEGACKLKGAPVMATDLRASLAW